MTTDLARKTAAPEAKRVRVQIVPSRSQRRNCASIELLLKGFAGGGPQHALFGLLLDRSIVSPNPPINRLMHSTASPFARVTRPRRGPTPRDRCPALSHPAGELVLVE